MVEFLIEPRSFAVGAAVMLIGFAGCYLFAMSYAPTLEARKTWAICSGAGSLLAIALLILAEVVRR